MSRTAPTPSRLVFNLLNLLSAGFFLMCFVPVTVFAQATSGTLTGTVTDQTGAVVPNATVTITDTLHGSSVNTTTNGQGLFTRTQLANGTYNLAISASGFEAVRQNGVVVDVDRETRLNITMRPGGTQQTVEVVANEAPVL